MAGLPTAPRHPRAGRTNTPYECRTCPQIPPSCSPARGARRARWQRVGAAQRPDLVEQASGELGADPFESIGEGTHFAQPALFIAGLAHWKAAGEPDASFYAGHSLGELPALVAAGALEASAGLRLATVRGRLMEEASAVRPGGMVAALGGTDEVVRKVAGEFGLTLANDNAPGQMVLSGDAEKVGEARKALRAEGAKAIRLPVAGAFHSPLMEPAVPGYREILDSDRVRRRAGRLLLHHRRSPSTTSAPTCSPR